MKRRMFMLSVFGAAILAGCTHDKPVEPPSNSVQQKYDAADLEVFREIDQIDREAESVLLTKATTTVDLPDGSVDALAAAIAAAGPGGVVRVRSGEHRESGTVTITQTVSILGEPGANLVVDTKPQPPGTIVPALHVLNAPNTVIWRLKIRAKEEIGNTGILVENSPQTSIGRNTILAHQFGILVQEADHTRIYRNTVSTTRAWETGQLFAVYGVVNINGDKVRIVQNDVSNAFFGVWACDREGRYFENTTHDNYIGFILCRVLDTDFVYPGGGHSGADASGNNWRVIGNLSNANLDAGYLVIDSANANFLKDNDASNNGTYDIDLTGDTFRFGPLILGSFDNTVIAGQFPNIKIKNCGENNTVVGGNLVDNATDPCF